MSTKESPAIAPKELNNTDDAAVAESRHGSACGRRRCMLGRATDPWAKWIREWNRFYLLACAAGLMVDPLFLYALSISGPLISAWPAESPAGGSGGGCGDGGGRDCEGPGQGGAVDVVREVEEGLGVGSLCDITSVAGCDVGSSSSSNKERINDNSDDCSANNVSLRVPSKDLPLGLFPATHAKFLGYIFGTIWWGIALNLMAYFVASHAVGACWYLLGIQRATKCLREQCFVAKGCGAKTIACVDPIYYGTTTSIRGERLSWAQNMQARAMCLDSSDNYQYGAYQWTVTLVTNPNRLEKILLPIFWGLMTLSTFGNLESTTEWVEIVFNIITITGGLLLVTMLIGNIKVFLHATTSKKQAMNLRLRSVEWWMKRKHLPHGFRQRVRQYERQRWAAMRGVDECQMIRNLPEGLRRDIKYHLCLDLVRQVPLFQHMDEVVLENICDRVKSLIFPKGEIITREGDPVQRMLFIVRGHLQSSQVLRDGVKSCCMLGPGNFSGDELLSWCLRRPFVERLPPSSFTLMTLETTEAFGLEASDVKYVTQHFRYTFVNEKVRRSARYYSPGWRMWAAVAIQLAWRRYRHRKTLTSLSFIRPRRPLSRCSSLGEEKLRLYTALLTSPKPNQDDFLM
uniref:Cyclic nucleotide-binding domain-containing protein n=1 Tax=Ananas comosus var. bracteatus TaxID=296719 RepID=A0A6V7QDB8_ANACO|nr:unnamed protein product [Ananas comosus var. bracteatus]